MSFGFAWPELLVALLLVPLAAAGYLLAERRRRASAAAFGNPALLAGLVAGRPGRRRHVPVAIALIALALLLAGLARPRASFSIGSEQATVILAIDVSGSMKATDVRPNRLSAARAAAAALLAELPKRYRVGIVSFSDTANTVLIPSKDRDAAATALAGLRVGGGTAIGAAILRAVALARPAAKPPALPTPADGPPATVVLLSDGAQTAGPPALPSAQLAAQAGVTISTVTLGTAAATVEVPLPDGQIERVQVQPDPATLKAIATTAHGTFQAAPDAQALKQAYAGLGSQLAYHKEPREITAAFAGAGALVLLLGVGLSTLWFRRVL